MVTVTVEEMQERLPGLLEDIKRGEDILITQADQPFARLLPARPSDPVETKKQTRQLGLGCNDVLYIADDFDAPLDDFKDYM